MKTFLLLLSSCIIIGVCIFLILKFGVKSQNDSWIKEGMKCSGSSMNKWVKEIVPKWDKIPPLPPKKKGGSGGKSDNPTENCVKFCYGKNQYTLCDGELKEKKENFKECCKLECVDGEKHWKCPEPNFIGGSSSMYSEPAYIPCSVQKGDCKKIIEPCECASSAVCGDDCKLYQTCGTSNPKLVEGGIPCGNLTEKCISPYIYSTCDGNNFMKTDKLCGGCVEKCIYDPLSSTTGSKVAVCSINGTNEKNVMTTGECSPKFTKECNSDLHKIQIVKTYDNLDGNEKQKIIILNDNSASC